MTAKMSGNPRIIIIIITIISIIILYIFIEPEDSSTVTTNFFKKIPNPLVDDRNTLYEVQGVPRREEI